MGSMPGRSPTVTLSDDGALTVAIEGEFDMATTFSVEPALEQALETPGLRRVTLDLSGLTFIDSVGIGVVIQLAADLEARGHRAADRARAATRPARLHHDRDGRRAAVRARGLDPGEDLERRHTTAESNCVPACLRSSASAASRGSATPVQEREVVIAL